MTELRLTEGSFVGDHHGHEQFREYEWSGPAALQQQRQDQHGQHEHDQQTLASSQILQVNSLQMPNSANSPSQKLQMAVIPVNGTYYLRPETTVLKLHEKLFSFSGDDCSIKVKNEQKTPLLTYFILPREIITLLHFCNLYFRI